MSNWRWTLESDLIKMVATGPRKSLKTVLSMTLLLFFVYQVKQSYDNYMLREVGIVYSRWYYCSIIGLEER